MHNYKKSKHSTRCPAAPTPEQFSMYRIGRWYEKTRLGLAYQTGPRRGQQLADKRKADQIKVEAETASRDAYHARMAVINTRAREDNERALEHRRLHGEPRKPDINP